MPFIIWGSKGVENILGDGQFTCPDCGPVSYTHKSVDKYFTLYWIPLFKTSSMGDFVVCNHCENAYDPEILNFDPNAGLREFLGELHNAAMGLMAAMVVADGEIDEAELNAMVAASELLPNGPITLEQAQEAVNFADPDIDPVQAVHGVVESLNDNGKDMLFQVALAIAASDGEVADDEMLLLTRIGEALGMDVTESLANLQG